MFTGMQNSWRPPLFKIGKVPFHVVGLLVLIEVIGAIAAIAYKPLTALVLFSPAKVAEGELWRIATYPFFALPNFFWLIGLFFFYRFGSFLEHSISREKFVQLVVSITLLTPAIAFIYFLISSNARSSFVYDSSILHMSIFMAFCTTMPNAPSFGGIKVKWFGFAFLGVGLLQLLSVNLYGMALALLVCAAFAVFFVQKLGFSEGFHVREEIFGSRPRRRKKSPPRKRQQKKLKPRTKIDTSSSTEVDRILDKINDEGFHSLTLEEKATLEQSSK